MAGEVNGGDSGDSEPAGQEKTSREKRLERIRRIRGDAPPPDAKPESAKGGGAAPAPPEQSSAPPERVKRGTASVGSRGVAAVGGERALRERLPPLNQPSRFSLVTAIAAMQHPLLILLLRGGSLSIANAALSFAAVDMLAVIVSTVRQNSRVFITAAFAVATHVAEDVCLFVCIYSILLCFGGSVEPIEYTPPLELLRSVLFRRQDGDVDVGDARTELVGDVVD